MKKGIREGEREVGGDGVCGCSFGEPLKQETFQTSMNRTKLFLSTCLNMERGLKGFLFKWFTK
jgi:hypothetical protein